MLLVGVGALISWYSQRESGRSEPGTPEQTSRQSSSATRDMTKTASGAGFDFYLLSMTLHPAFCADGHARKAECRGGKPRMLSIHGLWPERLAKNQYPRDCTGPPLDLEPRLERELSSLMPGMAEGLHQHEWRKHGTCSGLDDDEYFQRTLHLGRRVDSLLADHLTTLAGGTTNTAELRAFANTRLAGFGDSLTFHCRTLRDAPPEHRREPYLVEIRQCLGKDGASGSPLPLRYCEDFHRIDQGCGSRFRIAEPERR